jgi:hypothetical protein
MCFSLINIWQSNSIVRIYRSSVVGVFRVLHDFYIQLYLLLEQRSNETFMLDEQKCLLTFYVLWGISSSLEIIILMKFSLEKIYLHLLFRLLTGPFYSQKGTFCRFSSVHATAHTYISSDITHFLRTHTNSQPRCTKNKVTWSWFDFSFPGQEFCQWNLYSTHTGRGLPWSANVATFL